MAQLYFHADGHKRPIALIGGKWRVQMPVIVGEYFDATVLTLDVCSLTIPYLFLTYISLFLIS